MANESELEVCSYFFSIDKHALRAKWIKLVNRQLKPGRNWAPDNDSRICSTHFETGNPVPTLHLGYELTTPVKLRQPPKERQPLTQKKKNLQVSRSELMKMKM